MITETIYHPETLDKLRRYISLTELSNYVRELELTGVDPDNMIIDISAGLRATHFEPSDAQC